MRIFENCRFFNPPNSPIIKTAAALENFFAQKLALTRKQVEPWVYTASVLIIPHLHLTLFKSKQSYYIAVSMLPTQHYDKKLQTMKRENNWIVSRNILQVYCSKESIYWGLYAPPMRPLNEIFSYTLVYPVLFSPFWEKIVPSQNSKHFPHKAWNVCISKIYLW